MAIKVGTMGDRLDLHLDPEDEDRIDDLAKERGVDATTIVREAVASLEARTVTNREPWASDYVAWTTTKVDEALNDPRSTQSMESADELVEQFERDLDSAPSP